MTDLVYVPQAECQRLRSNPEALATTARINCLSMVSEASSGHIGASFSSLDILLYLALNEPDAQVILSRGHELPAYLAVQHAVGNLPDEALHQLRKPGGIPGHPTPGCAPGINYSSGSLGQGISKAKGMILADRLQGVKRRYFVLVGDGELDEGQNWEAFHSAVDCKLNELTVVIDANGYQTESRTSWYPDSVESLLESFGFDVFGMDGHIYEEKSEPGCFPGGLGVLSAISRWADAWERSADYRQPTAIVAKTTKGRGVSFFEADPARWHSGAPNEEEYIRAAGDLGVHAFGLLGRTLDAVRVPHTWPAPKPPDPFIAAYSEALCDLAAENERIVVLDADLAKDCGLLAFRGRFPERYITCGIAEQDMVTTASGLAIRGFIPICHSFAAFLTRRALDQIYNQVCEGTQVLYVGSMAGRLPETGPGKSHEVLTDVEIMQAVGIKAYSPGRPEYVKSALIAALASGQPSYIRLCRQVAQ